MYNSYYEKILATGEVKCIDEEIPFEIPESWEWVRLTAVSIIQEGPGIRSFQYKENGVQLLTVTNILEGQVDLKKAQKYISENEYVEKYQHFQLNNGDIVCACSGGSWGKSAIYELINHKIILNTSTLRLRFYADIAFNEYLYLITKTHTFKQQLADQLSGMQPNFGYAHYSKILIPFPPLCEQIQIVKRIEQIIPWINKYQVSEEELMCLDVNLNTELKKSILQYAIQGKLVHQIDTEEPATILLEQIRAEKLRLLKEGKLKKKDIQDSVIFKDDDNRYYEKVGNEMVCIDDELPFDIPKTWTWINIGALFYIQTGASFKKEQANSMSKGVRILRGGNISPDYYSFKDDDIFIDESLVTPSILLRKNDLITPAVTSLENVGKMARVLEDYDDVSAGGFVFILRPHLNNEVHSQYLCAAIQSPYLTNKIKSITKKSGSAFYNIGKERLVKLYLPLPPLAEQSRIVNALNSVLKSIEG